MANEKRAYNNLGGLFQEFISKDIYKMLVDHDAMGYKDARSAHRSLHNALKGGLYSIAVKWSGGDVYLTRTDKKY